jgi:hypothetical protein
MTPSTLTPLPRTTPRPALHRRVKRGIVAGYLHDLTQRHGDTASERPLELPRRAVAAAKPAER